MNSVILCEGRTDAIILSYYLIKTSGWTFTKKSPKLIQINEIDTNQEVNWYTKDNDYLLIFGVGGKDNFENVYQRYIKDVMMNYDQNTGFYKLVILRDKDEKSIEDLIAENNSILGHETKNQKWVTCSYQNRFDMEQEIKLLSVVIPKEDQGALEHVLLSAISENAYDKNIVDKSSVFIESFDGEADEYIGTERLKVKAKLSVVLSVLSPEQVFTEIDKRLCSIEWDKYEKINEHFNLLSCL